MKITKLKLGLLMISVGLFTISCETDSVTNNEAPVVNQIQGVQKISIKLQDSKRKALEVEMSENIGDALTNKAVDPSTCSSTQLAVVQNRYILSLIQDPTALANYSLYLQINQLYARYLAGDDQYFGEDGDYTKLMVKRQRELEKFWDMPNEIKVNGQHTATLNDREKLADVFEAFGTGVTSRDIAYEIADELIAINATSPNLPENPFFATDGFATYDNTIVIGDGIVQWMSEAGVDTDIVWTGILAHEWAHEVQFNNYFDWYPGGQADPDPVAATRYTELEADFLAGYFMTHKRGATYNWKRVEQFFNLFYQIGDCGFTSSGHHGTPLQRLAASHLGYELAQSAQKQGHILSPQQAHDYFAANINSIISE